MYSPVCCQKADGAARSMMRCRSCELREFELFLEFRLAGEDDLQKLFRGSLQIGKHRFLRRDRSGFWLVNDRKKQFRVAVAFEKHVIEFQELLAFGLDS